MGKSIVQSYEEFNEKGLERQRIALDHYKTPAWCTELLLDRIENDLPFLPVILEPYAGTLDIVSVLHEKLPIGKLIITNDINEDYSTHYHIDTLKMAPREEIDLVITNPPYTEVEKHIAKCLELAPEVWMLLRLSVLEPTRKRKDLLHKHLKSVCILPKRPRFRQDTKGSDSITSAWFNFSTSTIKNVGVYYL